MRIFIYNVDKMVIDGVNYQETNGHISMLIDFYNAYTNPEEMRDLALRNYTRFYHRYGQVDIYKHFPNAPYWGDGPDIEEDEIEGCIIDHSYLDWFDKLAMEYEEFIYEEMYERQKTILFQFQDHRSWCDINLRDGLTVEFLQYLNDRNITYVRYFGIHDWENEFFIKMERPSSDMLLRFGYPGPMDFTYAVTKLGWTEVNLIDLLDRNVNLDNELDEIKKWIFDNCDAGIIISSQHRKYVLYYESEIDVMATKLRWMKYDYETV